MSFQQDKYSILSELITPEEADVLLARVKERAKTANSDWQSPGSPAVYADPVMETLLRTLLPKISIAAELELLPAYSYFRLYQKGATLAKHRDRGACEISISLNLGYDAEETWPIWFNNGPIVSRINAYKLSLERCDAVLYRGMELVHWRDEFKGNWAAQVFLHYVDKNGPLIHFADDRMPKLNKPVID